MQVQNVKNYFYEKKIDGYQGGYPVSRHTEYLAGHPVSVWQNHYQYLGIPELVDCFCLVLKIYIGCFWCHLFVFANDNKTILTSKTCREIKFEKETAILYKRDRY